MTSVVAVIGASRGVGAAVATHLEARGTQVVAASRTPAAAGLWVTADIATETGVNAVVEAVGDAVLDALLFTGGTWEAGAFTGAYRFADSPVAETRQVIGVNLIAPILLAQALAPALARSANPRILLIGSLSGRDGGATVEVANTASKFGLRGAAQALEIALREQGVGVTVLNPGNLATDEVIDDIAEGRFEEQVPIPLRDLLACIDLVLALSPDATLREIDLAQKHPG